VEFRAEISSASLDKFTESVKSRRHSSELSLMMEQLIDNEIFFALRQDFERTRRKGDFSPGGGTPVKSGRLQRSLTTEGRSSVGGVQRRMGRVTMKFGTTLTYAPKVERKYQFMEFTFNKIGLAALNKVKRGLPSRIRAALRRAGVS
jgi:hypothetical protein